MSPARCACLGCDFGIVGDGFDPVDLSERLGIEADWSLPPVAATLDRKGLIRDRGRRGCWLLHSKGRVVSEDVNEHLRHLLKLLLPHRETIAAAAEGGVVAFSISWSGPVYPYGDIPSIAADCVAGIAELHAQLDIIWR